MIPTNPVSPKVTAAAIAGFTGPVLLSLVLAGLDWLTTDAGHSWLGAALAGTPPLVLILVYALVGALSAGLAGYAKTDPLRVNGLYGDQVPTVATSNDFGPVDTWTPGDDEDIA